MLEMCVGGGMCRLEYGDLNVIFFFLFEDTLKLISGPNNV